MNTIKSAIQVLDRFQSNPGKSDSRSDSSSKTLTSLKKCFQLLSSESVTNLTTDQQLNLTQLFIDGFDQEQIWQQLELKNRFLSSYVPVVTDFLVNESNVYFPCLKNETFQASDKDCSKDLPDKESSNLVEPASSDESSDEDIDEPSEQGSDNELEPQPKKAKALKAIEVPKSGGPKSIVDDEFFKLNEMEKFLDEAEKGELDDSIDYFDDLSDTSSTDKNATYEDFFFNPGEEMEPQDLPEGEDELPSLSEGSDEDESDNGRDEGGVKKVKFALDESEDSSSDDETNFKLRESKLHEKIKRLEDKNLSNKPWQYKGEVDVSGRPINSLLEEVLDVDLSIRPPPVITENVTLTLEQLILSRIRDSAYDDVERKVKPVRVPHELRKELVLNQEKSKYSLAEVYEQEYLKRKPTDANAAEETKKRDPEKEKIKRAMRSVFHKLDILSNFHYTPKPASADIQVVSNMPAITMEEVTPVAMSDANLLAPQEVSNIAKRKLLSKDERTKTDKLRERRKKKKFLSQKFKRNKNSQSAKISKVLKAKNVSLIKNSGDSNIKSSTAFFKKLQENNDAGKLVKIKKKKQSSR